MTNPDLLALANELDDIETDIAGKCNWSEVATVSSALRCLASSEGGVKVRELEWQFISKAWVAETKIGGYEVIQFKEDGRNTRLKTPFHTTSLWFDSVDAAKAAAQADYEARIRSALVEVPAVKGEPVAWADSHGLERPIDAEAMKHLRNNPTTEVYWSRFSIPLYTAPPADAGMREALERLHELSTTELRNTSCLMSSPPQSSAAWNIRNAIEREIESLTAPGATTKSDGGEQPPHVGLDWKLSDDAKARLAEIDAAIVRPGDPRLDQIVGGPSPIPFTGYGEYTPVTVDDPNSATGGDGYCGCTERCKDRDNCQYDVKSGDGLNDQDEVLLAYGMLWGVTTTDKRVHAARRELLKCLNKELQAKAISAARTTIALVRDIRRLKGATFAADFNTPNPSDPSSTRSDVTVEIKHLISSARAFLAHFNPCDLAEDKSQQWQSLEHQCNRVERALLDQFEIRRK